MRRRKQRDSSFRRDDPPGWGGGFPRPSRPRAVEGGIKAHSKAGSFGENWWARRWQDVLEGFHVGGRLARGRNYARGGQVLAIDVGYGVVKARVQGSRPKPYDVTIQVKVLTPDQWHHLVEVLSGQALFVAKLLAGEMPNEIEGAFQAAGLSMFPEKRGDLKTTCSCPDEANPCKHIAAVYYLLGEEFDRDPFLLFRMRGLDREHLVEQLGQGPRIEGVPALEEPPPPPAEPLPEAGTRFWGSGEVAEDVYGQVQQPPVSAGWVRRLGKFPFWRGEKPLLDGVEPVYVQAGEIGLRVFLGEKPQS